MAKNNEKADLTLSSEEFYKRYGRKKTVGMFTLGCKVNQYESESIARLFEDSGYETVPFEHKADVYVINTCTVTGLSARKSRQMIRRARTQNSDAVVTVIGCYPQASPDEVAQIPEVDIIIGTKDRANIVKYVEQFTQQHEKLKLVDNIMDTREFEELGVDTYKGRTRAFLKIQEGCSQFCTYCIIPYARGPIRSRDPERIIEEVKKLSENGFKEVVLTGIHLESYGKDFKNAGQNFNMFKHRQPLLDIISRIHEIEGICRIRLGSLEPNIITPDFVRDAANLPKLCPHYHISLQSGCDETLKRMNRKYTAREYKNAVELLRENIPDVAITTDIMVGFPGETEEEFEKSYEFAKSIGFASMHVFKYSPRKGTPAANFPNQTDPVVKEERSKKMIELSSKMAFSFNARFAGRKMDVLFEQECETNKEMMEGLTANYIRVLCRKIPAEQFEGNIKRVRITKAYEEYVTGDIC